MSNTDPNAKSNPASESTSPRTLSPTTSLRTKKSRNTLYRYFFGADGRATRKDVPGEEYDPDRMLDPMKARVHRFDNTSGLNVYKAHALALGHGGGTRLCPFDCNCCF